MAKEMSSAQKRLFALLKKKDAEGSQVSTSEITVVTSWKKETVGNYIGKGYFLEFLTPLSNGNFQVSGLQNLSEKEFHQSITQSNIVREISYGFTSKTAKALIKKSRDNITLALEVYNRPSLSNRIDGFLMLFCAAWEQLLKAILAEVNGEDSIFRKQKEGRIRETLSLRECVDKHFSDSNNPVRKNIESIVILRDKATHLFLPELQDIAGRLFQSGVINFADEFRRITGQGFVDDPSVGLLTLICDFAPPNAIQLEMRYGLESATELLDIAQKLKNDIDQQNDPKFAIPIEYKLVFSKDSGNADITLSNVVNASNQAVIIEKMVDPTERCPYITRAAAKEISKLLETMIPKPDREKRFSSKNKKRDYFSDNDFLAICETEGWKKSNNEYHHFLEIANRHIYSQKVVDFISQKVASSETYLTEAREKYRSAIQRKRR
jgi:hypothetical protein